MALHDRREEEIIKSLSKPRKYQAIFISDIHLSNRLPYAVPTTDGMTDRLEEQKKIFDRIVRVLKKKPEIKDVWILGDFFDKGTVDPVTLTFAARQLARLLKIDDVTVYILPGNHDSNSTKGGRFITEAFGAMGFDRLISLKTGFIQLKGEGDWLRFFPLAYSTKEAAESDLATYLDDHILEADADEFVNVLLMHHSINGCEHGGWTCDDGLDADTFVKKFSLTLSGHFHEHQFFGEDLEGFYLGSPMHHRFDDVGRKAQFWVIKFSEDGNHVCTDIDPGLAKFWIVKSLDEEVPEGAMPGDFIRFRIKATKEDWAKQKLDIELLVSGLKERGYRADFLFVPISSAKSRMTGEEVSVGGSVRVRTIEEQIAIYAEHVGSGDLEAVKKLGREILQEARLAR